jgi:sulfotransferase family protein
MTKYFILFGSPRSGTTLLAQTLSAHSQVIIPGENDFLAPANSIMTRVRDAGVGRRLIADLIVHSVDFPRHLGEYFDRAEVAALVYGTEYTLPALFRALYGALAQRLGKSLAGDKSPNDMAFARSFAGHGLLDAPMRLVHIVRDVRDMMESFNRMKWVKNLDLFYARNWATENLYLYSVFGLAENYYFLRYEDFVSDPRHHLESLCEFMQIGFEDRMLDPSNFSGRYRGVPAHAHLYAPISTAHVGKGRVNSTPEQLRCYEEQAAEALRCFGYQSAI